MNTATLTHSLRAMHAAARPCGTSEDGRTVLAIHADAHRLEDLLAAAERLLAATGDAVVLCPTYGAGRERQGARR